MGFFIRWRNWVISICNIPVFCLSFFFSVLSNTQTHLHVLPGWLVQLLAWPTYRGRKLLKGTDVGWGKRKRKEEEEEEEEEEEKQKKKNGEEEENKEVDGRGSRVSMDEGGNLKPMQTNSLDLGGEWPDVGGIPGTLILFL